MSHPLISDWWSEARGVSHDLAPKVRLVGASKTKQDPNLLLRAKREYLHRHLLRLGLVASLEHRNWFRLRGRTDYLETFREKWKESEGPYRFDQRLGMLFYSALNQPSSRARDLVRAHVGEVPYLGTGLFNREQFEQEFDDGDGFGLVPDELHAWFFEGGGIESARASADQEPTASIRERCKREIAAFLETDPSLSKPSPDWAERLREIHAHDPACGNGIYLSAMLSELCRISRACQEAGAEPETIDPPHTILQRCLSGLELDTMLLQEGRFRLVQTAFLQSRTDKPRPLPDLREIVRLGRPVSGAADRPRLEEGAKVEFKATFEWNVKKAERSGDLRLGVLKSIAAFLNSEGGVLFIGVADSGTPIGIDDDLAQIDDPYPVDAFEGRMREFFKNHLDPVPLNAVRIEFPTLANKTVCRIEVDSRQGVTYLLRKGPDGRTLEEVYVRDGNRTLNLTGRMRDQFVLGRSFH